MKTEVYSWRVSADLKSSLEREALRQKTSMSAVLDAAARDWLTKVSIGHNDDEEQLRIRNAASASIGSIKDKDPYRSQNARKELRERLRKKLGR